jgi:hypothetical protein
MTIPPQQDAEIIKPGHDALKFYAIDQKNCERRFALAYVIEKSVLKILRSVGCHCRWSVFFCSQPPAAKRCLQAAPARWVVLGP